MDIPSITAAPRLFTLTNGAGNLPHHDGVLLVVNDCAYAILGERNRGYHIAGSFMQFLKCVTPSCDVKALMSDPSVEGEDNPVCTAPQCILEQSAQAEAPTWAGGVITIHVAGEASSTWAGRELTEHDASCLGTITRLPDSGLLPVNVKFDGELPADLRAAGHGGLSGLIRTGESGGVTPTPPGLLRCHCKLAVFFSSQRLFHGPLLNCLFFLFQPLVTLLLCLD